jgi:hypothetical protein
MNRLVIQPTATAQWHDLVNEAQQAARCRLDETLESYLVFLLERFSRRPDMLSRILGKDYLEACAQSARQREQLRDIGDHCLLFSGLFPQIAERRLVKISYFVSLGRSAYLRIATEWYDSEQQANDLYSALSQGFVQLMDILQAIRGLDDEHNERLKPIQAFELWQETGSQQAYRVLTSISEAFPSPAEPDDSSVH